MDNLDQAQEVVDRSGGGVVTAFTYVARDRWVRKASTPFTWYKRLVCEGAKARELPEEYVAGLGTVTSREDPNGRRTRKAEKALLTP